MIGTHLTTAEYHKLRISTPDIRLPLIHTMNFKLYKLATQHRNTKLNLETLTEYAIHYLVSKELVDEFTRAVRSVEFQTLKTSQKYGIFPSLMDVRKTLILSSSSRQMGLALVGRLYNTQAFDDSLLSMAALFGDLEVTKKFLAGRKVNETRNAFILACFFGHVDICAFLIDKVVPEHIAFCAAIKNGHTEIVKLFMKDNRIDPALDDYYAFLSAICVGKIDVVRVFMDDERVDVTYGNNKPLKIAIMSNRLDLVKVLLSDTRIEAATDALCIACNVGNVDMVQEILKFVDASIVSVRVACAVGNLPVLKLLMRDLDISAELYELYGLAI